MLMQSMRKFFRKAATLMVCCLLCGGGGANQARQPLLLEELDTPVIEIPDLSKSTVKTISFSWPAQGPESSAFGCESTLFLPNCVRIRVLTSQIP